MVCNICGANEATIHLTEIVNSQMIEIHLCEACAQEKGTDFKTHFNFGEIFAGISPLGQPEEMVERRAGAKCSQCGMTYEEFGKTGRLGCADCYPAFSRMLLPLIRRVQRSTQHTGKRPAAKTGGKPPKTAVDLKLLQERLRKSIQSESFEEAAKIRDQIKIFEESSKKNKKGKNE